MKVYFILFNNWQCSKLNKKIYITLSMRTLLKHLEERYFFTGEKINGSLPKNRKKEEAM